MAALLRLRKTLVSRMAFVIAIQLSWIGATLVLRELDAPILGPVLSALAVERFFTQKGWFLLSAILLVFSILFLLRIRELLSAAIVAACFYVISVLEHNVGYPQERYSLALLILPGSLLITWVLGQLLYRSRDIGIRDHLSMELTRGTLAASLFLAGLAKAVEQGWMDPLHQQNVILERVDEQALPVMAPLQEMIAAHPVLCAMGGSLVVLSQLSACLFVIPRFRKPIAVAILLGLGWCALILNIKSLVPAILLFAVTWHSLTGTADEPVSSGEGSP